MEALWLLAVVLVPIAFLDRDYIYSEAVIAYLEVPKVALLRTLVALMTVLWLIEWGVKGGSAFNIAARFKERETRFNPLAFPAALRSWISRRPARWVVLAVWFFGERFSLSEWVSFGLLWTGLFLYTSEVWRTRQV